MNIPLSRPKPKLAAAAKPAEWTSPGDIARLTNKASKKVPDEYLAMSNSEISGHYLDVELVADQRAPAG